MVSLIIIFTYLLIILHLIKNDELKINSNDIIKSLIILSGFIAIITEVLSLFSLINFIYTSISWLLLFLILFSLNYKKLKKINLNTFKTFKETIKEFPLLSIIIFVILGITYFLALVYPPNTWDSMTYHMSRVMHWMSNQSLAFYPTAIDRQLFQMPFAEIVILHLQILSGSDYYANLVQWVAYLASCFVIIQIAKEFGLCRFYQLVSVIIFLTIPMAILQASSTQNDLVVSFFILCFALYMLRLIKNFNLENVIFASLSLGLALFTKGTAWIYCAGVGVVLSIPILISSTNDIRKLILKFSLLTLTVLFALVLNFGHLARTYIYYGVPISTGSESINYFSENYSFKSISVNITRNIFTHLSTPSENFNYIQYKFLYKIFKSDLDIKENTWPNTKFYISYKNHEDHTGNLLHILFIISALVVFLLKFKRLNHTALYYLISILFCTILYFALLKWQPWASRLHTPIFALFSPLIALTFIYFRNTNKNGLVFIFISILALYSSQYLFTGKPRDLLSFSWLNDRDTLYFSNRQHLFESYNNIAIILSHSNISDVGICIGPDTWEYPLWTLTNNNITFHHICSNYTLNTSYILFDIIITSRNHNTPVSQFKKYKLLYTDFNFIMYVNNNIINN